MIHRVKAKSAPPLTADEKLIASIRHRVLQLEAELQADVRATNQAGLADEKRVAIEQDAELLRRRLRLARLVLDGAETNHGRVRLVRETLLQYALQHKEGAMARELLSDEGFKVDGPIYWEILGSVPGEYRPVRGKNDDGTMEPLKDYRARVEEWRAGQGKRRKKLEMWRVGYENRREKFEKDVPGFIAERVGRVDEELGAKLEAVPDLVLKALRAMQNSPAKKAESKRDGALSALLKAIGLAASASRARRR